ncbi:adipocyte plasma membrane-associated protein-like protein, partial [Dinothrombium tinctorium]
YFHSIPLPNSFSGALKENDLLSKTVHLFEGEIKGPESIAAFNGDVYTALADGRVIRVRDDAYTVVADVSESPCEGRWDEAKCGHPLGIRFDSKGYLYFIDAYHGLKRLDLVSKELTTVFNISTQANGRASKLFDDFVIDEAAGAKGGNVYYMTDVSDKWPLDHILYCAAEHNKNGRVLKYDEETKTTSVLVERLSFPNGIELNDAKDALIVAVANERRLIKIQIKGSEAGKVETFLDLLPGEPDNIRRSVDEKQTFWVAFAIARNSSHPTVLDIFSNKPMLRKVVLRFIHALGSTLQYFGSLTNFVPLIDFGHKVKTELLVDFLMLITRLHGLVIEVDSNGKIVRSLHSPDGHTFLSSEAREVIEGSRKVLYIGSFLNNYLGKLYLN